MGGLLTPVAYTETRADQSQGGLWCTDPACTKAMRTLTRTRR
jgi:hypothetical protein